MTPASAVRQLIAVNLLAFGAQLLLGDWLLEIGALWPWRSAQFQYWQIVSYAFLHGGGAHLALNMFGLWMFGRDVERALGYRYFMQLYFAAVVTAAATQLCVIAVISGTDVSPTVGASGGVFGVLLAFGMLFPQRQVMLLFPPIPMPAWVLVAGYAAIELVNGVLGTQAGVAHFAHLGGMLGAYLVLRRLGPLAIR